MENDREDRVKTTHFYRQMSPQNPPFLLVCWSDTIIHLLKLARDHRASIRETPDREQEMDMDWPIHTLKRPTGCIARHALYSVEWLLVETD